MAEVPLQTRIRDAIKAGDDAAAEAIIGAAALIAGDQTGDVEKFVGIFLFQEAQEGVARGRRETKAEAFHCFAIEAAIFEIRCGYFAFGAIV